METNREVRSVDMTCDTWCTTQGRLNKVVFVLCQVREVPGITIFRSSATVYFANAELYLEALKQKVVSL